MGSLFSTTDDRPPPEEEEQSIEDEEEFTQPLFSNGRYDNPWSTWKKPGMLNAIKWKLSSSDKSGVPSTEELNKTLPIVKPKFNLPPIDNMRVTWLGHASVLVQMEDITLLTDPIFSERASPVQFLGPKRYRNPPCTVHDLPPIDAVLISHNHYDHLDYNTVCLLKARFGANLRWFVPKGLKSWMKDVGATDIVELTWWEESCLPLHSHIKFIFTPAQHWCKRTASDDNMVLWGSWCVIGEKQRFFFAGDTGYCAAFTKIGQMYGPFDLAAIPIGAYEPRWFMKYQHVDPEQAVQIHEDVLARQSIGIHWGTFALAHEHYLDPPKKLSEALSKRNIAPHEFFTVKHGGSKLVAMVQS